MQKIKQLLLSRWSFSRILFLVLGILILIESIEGEMWLGIIIGLAFLGMGIFRLGCASGSCYRGSYYKEIRKNNED